MDKVNVTLEYMPQYMDFDDNLKPLGVPLGFQWVLGITKSPTQSLHTKHDVKPTARTIRRAVKAYMRG